MTNFAPELFLRLMESKIVLSGTVCDDDVVRKVKCHILEGGFTIKYK